LENVETRWPFSNTAKVELENVETRYPFSNTAMVELKNVVPIQSIESELDTASIDVVVDTHSSTTEQKSVGCLPGKYAGLMGTFVDYLGLGSIFPLIPYFVAEQNAHVIWLGAIISLQYVGVFLGAPFFGRLCDVYGPKKVMSLVLAADVLLFLATGFAPNVYVMVGLRFLAGFFTPMPVGTAWIGICVPADQKAKAFHLNTMAILGGFMLGCALGALAADLFYACLSVSILGIQSNSPYTHTPHSYTTIIHRTHTLIPPQRSSSSSLSCLAPMPRRPCCKVTVPM
jgi:hypothetical protein